ncbi:hypothetical protein C8R43DRAFT_967156 [Mycena crocata]|nr:hypothetical protein C8R43DRAFT_967156 [Mycena crocata]
MAENFNARGSKLPYSLPETCGPLFQTNEPPGDTELAEIAESLRVARALKASLELQLMETRMNLLRLEREDMHVAHHIERCNQLLAPIRRIPTEILITIFACYADLGNAIPPTPRGFSSMRDGVWALGHVCGHWRAVALSTPALWSCFSFRCATDRSKYASALTEEFLRRSGNHSLTIDFSCFERDNENWHLHCRAVFGELLARSRQWEVATFHPPKHLYDDMHTIEGNLPLLKELTLSPMPGRDYIAFPWHQLTAYHGAASYDDVDILPLAPNLKKCSLQFDAGVLPLTHQMRSLTLTGGSAHYQLHHLNLPALEHLSFSMSDRIRDFSSIAALARSAPALSSLEMLFHTLDPLRPTVLDFFAAVPTIERLHIAELRPIRERGILSAFMFDGLMQRADATVPLLLPVLTHLTLSGVAFDLALVRMVESRCVDPAPGRARLTSLGVADVGATDMSLLLRLRQFERQMDLKLTIE